MKNLGKKLSAELRKQELQKVNRAKELVKLLERLVKQDHLYDSEKLQEMKKQLRVVKEEISEIKSKTSKGFGKK